MKLHFDEMEETRIEGFYGGEGGLNARMFVDDRGNRILKGSLSPGSSIGLHKHEGSLETVFILSGTGKAVCDDVVEELGPGDCHYCPEGGMHGLVNNGDADLVFYAVVPKLS